MKNKLTLNEDLFTPIEIISCEDESSEEPLSAPQSSAASGMAQVINNLIVDEWDAISGYNSALETVKVQGMEHQEEAIKILTDIVNEENIHVGQLQKLLELYSPNAESINSGVEEADKQIIETDPTLTESKSTFEFDDNEVQNAETELSDEEIIDTISQQVMDGAIDVIDVDDYDEQVSKWIKNERSVELTPLEDHIEESDVTIKYIYRPSGNVVYRYADI